LILAKPVLASTISKLFEDHIGNRGRSQTLPSLYHFSRFKLPAWRSRATLRAHGGDIPPDDSPQGGFRAAVRVLV